jgi:integrase
MSSPAAVKTWNRTSVQNLIRHKSGRYYARVFANGKETWKALKTDILEVAKVKLREIAGPIQRAAHATQAEERGRMTIGECAEVFTKRINEGFGLRGRGRMLRRIGEGTKHYRKQTITALWSSWPGLAEKNARKISEREVSEWAERFAAKYSATRYNNTLDTLRALFRIAVDAGVRIDNPAEKVGRAAVMQKQLALPERGQFHAFVDAIRTAGAWCSRDCADFVEFLAYTGARKNEAANVTWADVDFVRQRIHLRVTKGGKPRFVPIISRSSTLLHRMRAERADEPLGEPVLRVREAQKAMDSAAEKIGIARITHHDLRHLFATACIESGVDIPSVSRWLGHRDGGALAMRTYGHLRDEHSANVAKLVSFDPVTAAA